MTAVVITRHIFGGMGASQIALFYGLAIGAIAIFLAGWWRRVRKYRDGRPLVRRWWRRPEEPGTVQGVTARPSLLRSLADVLTNRPIRRRRPTVGLAHLLVFWGFLGLLLATTIVGVDYDLYGHLITGAIQGHQRSFLVGSFYEAFNAVFNAAGLAVLVGTVMLTVRRVRGREPQLRYARVDRGPTEYSRARLVEGDYLFLGLLLAILVSGFVVQGLRILGAGFPFFERWTWLGWWVGRGLSALGVTASSARLLHGYLWWVHGGMALAFVASIPFTKAMHMVSSPVNLVANDPGATRRLPPVTADHIGYAGVSDFTWKELLDFDACTKCGRCHDVCPARTAGAALSPRDVILDLRQWIDRQRRIPAILDREIRPDGTGPAAGAHGPDGTGPEVAGDVVTERALWACTTCMACVEACPVGIEHVPTIVQLRRRLVDQGRMEPTLQTALQNLAQQGNSFGKSARMRARWTKGLDFPVKDARKEAVELLWFVGDHASFDERMQSLSQALARVLHRAGVDFGILYDDERNAGNDVRRVGEEGLFELLAEHNMGVFERAQFQEIFTTDPHSFNTLRNEYPTLGLDVRVRHYSQLLADLLESGTLPARPLGLRVTYHDPCYLARYNRVTEAPRRVLRALGCDVVEMPRNRDNTFCCGAGGGRIWMDDSHLTERPSENRIKEAATLGVERFVVSCPKDFAMYSDAAKTTGHDADLVVSDLVQLVEMALEVEPLAAAVASAGDRAPAGAPAPAGGE
ncbi:4Fe-4S dicluster domain-containing protein [Acidimicrobiaceae bacterium USS-CC1]|uniref:4Fe-4S dicluster domain-containing protein n=1 Tax=Acidiferrimicrobium australe TaxID=2664430 RepID=A0ABW9QTV0_9ACTN|nr:4Fe-4S dicluster domain-containing protein [Acidiferrimicrobium australe]